jgi:hypothetical protein
MGFRFYRRVNIIPGVTLNLSKRNASVSLGPRGAKVTVGTAGSRATVGVPGTGMYWTEKLGGPPSTTPRDAEGRRGYSGWWWWLLIGFIVLLALAH